MTARYVIFVLFLAVSCSTSETTSYNNAEVLDFVRLLVDDETPTLAEYQRFVGIGDPGERELAFELQECRNKGWKPDSSVCKAYIRQRWQEPQKHKSLYLSWLRENFSTPNESHRILRVHRSAEGFAHERVDVSVGPDTFVLFHNTDAGRPTGIVVDVISVNGKRISDLIPTDVPK